jgi:osmotically inducible lipoprotein OsmB
MVGVILLPLRFAMKTKILSLLLVPLALSVSACGDTWGQRSVTGAGIGAGAGLAVGALAGWPLVGPALVGAALGGGIGAATTPGGIK